jgi:hypothetical protein
MHNVIEKGVKSLWWSSRIGCFILLFSLILRCNNLQEMPFSTLFTHLVFLSCASLRVHAAHRGITLAEIVDAMEFVLVEQDLPFTIPINPCSTFVDEIDSSPGSVPLNTGQQTSAEWVRIIFHDFITANIAAGTGYVLWVW